MDRLKGEALIEVLAEYAHDSWSGWMSYLFSKSSFTGIGDMVIPKWTVDRWKRQVATAYKDLSEAEKESDREEARNILMRISQNKPVRMNRRYRAFGMLEAAEMVPPGEVRDAIKEQAVNLLGVKSYRIVQKLYREWKG